VRCGFGTEAAHFLPQSGGDDASLGHFLLCVPNYLVAGLSSNFALSLPFQRRAGLPHIEIISADYTEILCF
jgi:hypothetical protein